MKIKLSQFRKNLREALTEHLVEDVDRLNRTRDGYGETEFEEDVDRLRRAKDGYGETEFEEHVDIYVDDEDDHAPVSGDESVDDMHEDDDKKAAFVQKNKEAFKKRYGDKGEAMLDKQASRMFKHKEKVKKEANQEDDTDYRALLDKPLAPLKHPIDNVKLPGDPGYKKPDVKKPGMPVAPIKKEATPPGFEKVVKALKHEKGVDNPWAVANAMKNKGVHPKKK